MLVGARVSCSPGHPAEKRNSWGKTHHGPFLLTLDTTCTYLRRHNNQISINDDPTAIEQG